MRIAYETMLAEFERVLTKYGFSPKRAHEAAEIFALFCQPLQCAVRVRGGHSLHHQAG